MRQLKAISKRWEYWSEEINGVKIDFRRSLVTKDCYVEATDKLAQVMGHESLAVMLGNNVSALDAIYREHRKWFLIDWVDEKSGRIQMGLRIAVAAIYCVSTQK